MHAEITESKDSTGTRGWVFYDADCPICVRWAGRFRQRLERRGFSLAPLQSRRARVLLRVPENELMKEMRVVTAGGTVLGGADALMHLAARIGGGKTVGVLAGIPGLWLLLRMVYRHVARNRYCLAGKCHIRQGGGT